jgi:3'-5' exoribonuclease
MKSPFVNEVEPNRVITASFLVHSKEIRQKKSGEVYLSLLLGDKTGELDAKMWDNITPEILDSFDRDDFVKVKGLIQVFHNRPQLTIHKMRRMDSSEIDFTDYFPCSRRDPAEMWAELRGLVGEMTNPHLKCLVEAMLDDPEIAERYRRAPAAKQIHHAYLGGLLEHVLSLCALARLTAGHYENLDRDLLLAGVVLHDIGKIYELNYERGFSYSNDGQLVGHIAIALRMVSEKLRAMPDFPPLLRSLLEHMILSHHGQLEFGSPKLPQFPEALLLHYIDDMDSKMACMRALIEHDRQVEGCFTTYSAALARPALKMDRYLNPIPTRLSGVAIHPANGRAGMQPANPDEGESSPAHDTSIPSRNSSDLSPDRQGAVVPAEEEPLAPAVPPPPPITPALAAHPLFGGRPNSAFADKLQQALRLEDPAEAKQEG